MTPVCQEKAKSIYDQGLQNHKDGSLGGRWRRAQLLTKFHSSGAKGQTLKSLGSQIKTEKRKIPLVAQVEILELASFVQSGVL